MAFNYFSLQPKTTTILGATFNYDIAQPTGSSVIDVHGDMIWKNPGSIDEVPSVILTEKSLDYGIWTSNLIRLLSNTSSILEGNTDPYGVLYLASETGFKYNLPYIVQPGSSLRGAINNSWNEMTQEQAYGEMLGAIPVAGGIMKSGFDSLTQIAAGIGKFVSPGYGFEPIKFFASTQAKSITITFPLYNTYSVEKANDHFSFVSLIAFQNLKTRTSYATYLPPKIYVVQSAEDGGIYMPAAYVSSLDIQSIGTTRAINDLGTLTGSGNSKRLIPEAYKVSITFTELLPESSNIYGGMLGGDVVSVIDNNTGDQETLTINTTAPTPGSVVAGITV
jgi:hypothetical protein